MQFGYTIIYVMDVTKTLQFYQKAFGCKTDFVSEDKMYGQLATGSTKLAFVAAELAHENLPKGYRQNRADELPSGFEIGFVADDVKAAYDQAVVAGAKSYVEPEEKPWGQTVGYVRDPEGILIEICSPLKDPNL